MRIIIDTDFDTRLARGRDEWRTRSEAYAGDEGLIMTMLIDK